MHHFSLLSTVFLYFCLLVVSLYIWVWIPLNLSCIPFTELLESVMSFPNWEATFGSTKTSFLQLFFPPNVRPYDIIPQVSGSVYFCFQSFFSLFSVGIISVKLSTSSLTFFFWHLHSAIEASQGIFYFAYCTWSCFKFLFASFFMNSNLLRISIFLFILRVFTFMEHGCISCFKFFNPNI